MPFIVLLASKAKPRKLNYCIMGFKALYKYLEIKYGDVEKSTSTHRDCNNQNRNCRMNIY